MPRLLHHISVRYRREGTRGPFAAVFANLVRLRYK